MNVIGVISEPFGVDSEHKGDSVNFGVLVAERRM